MKEEELLMLACIFAERDQEALMLAYDHIRDDQEYKKAKKFVAAIRKYRLRRWGKTFIETMIENCESVSFEEVAKRCEHRGST